MPRERGAGIAGCPGFASGVEDSHKHLVEVIAVLLVAPHLTDKGAGELLIGLDDPRLVRTVEPETDVAE